MTNQVLHIDRMVKHYGAELILDAISLSLNQGDRVALVGENGVGKTTLLHIILGKEQADSGRVWLAEHIDTGYMPQEVAPAQLEQRQHLTIRQFLEQSLGNLNRIRDEMRAIEQAMAAESTSEEQLQAALARYGELQQQFELKGGYTIDHRLEEILAGLELAHIDQQHPLAQLSGGEKTRLVLAGLLLRAPGILLLDEPTNHLDFGVLAWFEGYLASYPGTVFAISHDRRFLNKVFGQIIELSYFDRKLHTYHGDYDFYIAEKERERQKQAAAYETWQDEVKTLRRLIKSKTHATGKGRPPSDSDKMAYNFFGERVEQTTSRNIRNARQRLEELLENPVERIYQRWAIDPVFDPLELGSQQVLRLEGISKQYDGVGILDHITQTVHNRERIVIVGPNGAGKSTLLKIITGLLEADSGEVTLAPAVKMGYLDQEQESLNLNATVLEAYRNVISGPESELRADLHRYGLFGGDEVHKQTGQLSIGQRRKLQIAMLVASRANLLLLDEPTNHLDLVSLEKLEQALLDFSGAILAVSHDRWFISHIATHVWHLKGGQITAFPLDHTNPEQLLAL